MSNVDSDQRHELKDGRLPELLQKDPLAPGGNNHSERPRDTVQEVAPCDEGYSPKESKSQTRIDACISKTSSSQASQYLELPHIIDDIGCACCDPCLLCRLAFASPSLHKLILPQDFAARLASELCRIGREWAKGCCTLEEIAVGQSVDRLCSRAPSLNHLYFPYGGGLNVLAETRHLLHGAACLAKRHPLLTIQIDAHVGAGAPREIATSVSNARACSISQDLSNLGVRAQQITFTAWGKKISSKWSEPEDDTAARAELFFCLASHEFPVRRSYYDLAPKEPRTQPEPHQLGTPQDNDREDDTSGPARAQRFLFSALGLLGRVRQGRVVFQRPPAPSDDSDEESELLLDSSEDESGDDADAPVTSSN